MVGTVSCGATETVEVLAQSVETLIGPPPPPPPLLVLSVQSRSVNRTYYTLKTIQVESIFVNIIIITLNIDKRFPFQAKAKAIAVSGFGCIPIPPPTHPPIK